MVTTMKVVDENADQRNGSLLVRVLHVCLCVSVRGRTHARFVREETALRALCERCQDTEGHAADLCLRIECAREDECERFAGCREIRKQHDKATDQVNDRHERNDLFRNDRQASNAADEHVSSDRNNRDAPHPCGNAESSFAGRSDGVRLHHASHEAECEDDRN